MSPWVAAAASTRGARHRHAGTANEDHCRVRVGFDRVVATVADGHGSTACTRAGTGARLATATLLDLLDRPRASGCDRAAALVDHWSAAVREHLADEPATASELDAVAGRELLLYGTTVLGVAVDAADVTVVQLGDGDVLLGSRGCRGAVRPVARDGATPWETPSLASANAAEHVRSVRRSTADPAVDVVVVATDGLDGAYAEPGWHDATMDDVLAGLARIARRDLPGTVRAWSVEPARVGGDDTTLAVMARSDLFADA